MVYPSTHLAMILMNFGLVNRIVLAAVAVVFLMTMAIFTEVMVEQMVAMAVHLVLAQILVV